MIDIKKELQSEIESVKILEYKTPNKSTRYLNFMVDFIIIIFIGMLVATFISSTFNLNNISEYTPFILIVLLYVGYYSIMEYYFQKTVGKMITKTTVVNIRDDKPDFNDILVRSVTRLIPFEFITLFWKNENLHDKLSNTLLVDDFSLTTEYPKLERDVRNGAVSSFLFIGIVFFALLAFLLGDLFKNGLPNLSSELFLYSIAILGVVAIFFYITSYSISRKSTTSTIFTIGLYTVLLIIGLFNAEQAAGSPYALFNIYLIYRAYVAIRKIKSIEKNNELSNY